MRGFQCGIFFFFFGDKNETSSQVSALVHVPHLWAGDRNHRFYHSAHLNTLPPWLRHTQSRPESVTKTPPPSPDDHLMVT